VPVPAPLIEPLPDMVPVPERYDPWVPLREASYVPPEPERYEPELERSMEPERPLSLSLS
jgi:hypothetical protein